MLLIFNDLEITKQVGGRRFAGILTPAYCATLTDAR
jgi:hypothetical protein